MTVIIAITAAFAVLGLAVIFGADVVGLLVQRSVYADLDDRALVQVVGRGHYYADRRMPGVGIPATILTAVTAAAAFIWGTTLLGILSAAGLYALEHNVARLADDHANARRLADAFARIPALGVTRPDTNIVWVKVAPDGAEAFTRYVANEGFGITGGYGSEAQRWVTHLDVDTAGIDRAIAMAERFFEHHRA